MERETVYEAIVQLLREEGLAADGHVINMNNGTIHKFHRQTGLISITKGSNEYMVDLISQSWVARVEVFSHSDKQWLVLSRYDLADPECIGKIVSTIEAVSATFPDGCDLHRLRNQKWNT